jgi:hypothetical protein
VFYSLPADVDVIHINPDDDTVAVLHRMTLPFSDQNPLLGLMIRSICRRDSTI